MKMLLPLLLLTGCVGAPLPVQRDYVSKYAVVGPEYRNYVEADPALTPERRAIRLRLVDEWRKAAIAANEDLPAPMRVEID